MNAKQAAYSKANSYSFTLQALQVQTPVSDDRPTEIVVGIQPFGITSQPFGNAGDVVVIANYLAPAQHFGTVKVSNGTLTRELKRITGAMNGITWCRGGFPEADTVAQANRCWTAVLGSPSSGELLVGKGDPEFFRLRSPSGDEKQWKVTGRVELPRTYGSYPHKFIASATLLSDDRFFTVEHDGEYQCDAVEWEGVLAGRIKRVMEHPLGKFRYGIALARFESTLERLVTITAYHSVESPGIYLGDTRIVPDVFGNGICPLINGGALVTRRGMESPEADSLEAPGALIYIPPAMFPAGFEWVR
ncbi:MAG: hypothetical protein Q7R93_03375 [bacterium]|nr:hypothetical protein [bacterium]